MIDLHLKNGSRKLVIVIENDTIGDRRWCPTIAQSLREYASLQETGALDLPHVYQSPNGNKLTVTGGTWCGELLTHEDLPQSKESQEGQSCLSSEQPSSQDPVSG
jgi:hypothetical protein